MSIPDNPFQNTRNPNAVSTSPPPVLHLETSPGSASAPHVPSPPNEHHGPSGSHTPGGSLLVPSGAGTGTKTPRRVQWTSDSHIVQLHPIPPVESIEPASPVHTLDERNIDQLTAALERHRSNPGERRRRRPPSAVSVASSADETRPGTDDDYDYRLDVDPPALAPVGARDGAKLEQTASADSGRSQTEPTSLQAILDNSVNEHLNGQYIPFGETDGLPNITQSESRDDMAAAKDLVRAHTGKWGVLRRRVKGAGAVSRALGSAPGARAGTGEGFGGRRASVSGRSGAASGDPEKGIDAQEASRYPQLEVPAQGSNMGLPGGASVLSSLLALYGQQQAGLNSGTTSAASSRPGSRENSDDEISVAEHRSRRDAARRGWHGSGGDQVRHTDASTSDSNTPIELVTVNHADGRRPSQVEIHHERRPSDLARAGEAQHAQSAAPLLDDASSRSPGLLEVFKKARRQLKDQERPKAARSGAGVFGALIQNTQSISGVATPVGSTLAPAAHRPGYQLSRYSLPDPATTETPPPQVWRPHSRMSSRPTSRPGSVHSSTAVSANGDSPAGKDEAEELRKTLSTDDVSALKTAATVDKDGHGDFKSKRNKSAITLDSLGSLGKIPTSVLKEGGHAFKEGSQALRHAEKWLLSGGKTPLTTPPAEKTMQEGFFPKVMSEDDRRRKDWEAEKRRRKKAKEARKRQEIFIIQHVAAILARQQFIMKLARALMMFGSPSHRLETQIQATAKVLEINAQVVYLPGTMLISFGDDATHTSETKFLKQATGLDLGKLLATHHLYWNVVHDKMSVEQASKDLDALMTAPVYYSLWQTFIVGGLCSVFITVISFNGSFIDALMSIALGMLLIGVQTLAARNDMFSNVFEIAIATIISFVAAALASTGYFCYTALVSGGVVLILPGYIVLCGALELASRNITAGAVRIGYSVIYSLFLGFGISIGAELYIKITGLQVVGSSDYTCATTHANMSWWGVTPSAWWYFLCCPGFAFFISLRNQQPLFAKELPIMVLIACCGWVSNHFSAQAFPNRSDLTSAIGSFVVGTLGNLYGRISNGSSFPVTVSGILFQLPSGLANGGIFNFASESTSGSGTAYSSGFSVAQQLVSVAIGLTVGLFVSAAITHPFGGGRRRGSGIFSF